MKFIKEHIIRIFEDVASVEKDAKIDARRFVEDRKYLPQTKEDFIATYFQEGNRLNPNTFRINIDPNYFKEKLNFISNRGESIDMAADSLTSVSGMDIDESDIVEFVVTYKSVTDYWLTIEREQYEDLKNYYMQEFLSEQNDKLKHDVSYFDDYGRKTKKQIEFNKHSVDDELTVYYSDNVDFNTIKNFLISFNNARKKVENRFKLKLGREYKDPDASYKIFFGRNIVLDNNPDFITSAEFIRGYAEHSPSDSFYFNLPRVKSIYDDAKKDWIPDPNYKQQKSRTYNISKIEDLITHEIAHALYFQQPLINRKEWIKYYDDGGWEKATSLYGQENHFELFAETIVDIINDEEHEITKDLMRIFNF